MSESNEEYTGLAIKVAAKIVEDSFEAVSGGIFEGIRKAKVKFRLGFEAYIEANIARTSKVKTILDSDRPVNLKDIYVPLNFRGHKRKIFSDVEVMDDLMKSKKIIVMGNAGGGKSMFLRNINIMLLADYKKVLPIYYELRLLNSQSKKTMLDSVFTSLHAHVKAMNIDEFTGAVQAGRFALVLDGFDEIDHDLRRRYLEEINTLCDNYPKTTIIVTSREDQYIKSLQQFSVYHVEPMTKSQTISLLNKLDYEPDAKKVFIDKVSHELYDKHKDFLSIPLLTTMMLLTFSQYSDIPNKIHIFYQQAFEVLFQRHDRSKGGAFTRKSYTNLSIDVFQRIFYNFCTFSYIIDKTRFNDLEIVESIRSAIDYEKSVIEPELYLKDLTESVCILQRDGIEYNFVHRSFQEYFTALFLSKLDHKEMYNGINSILRRQTTDNTLEMLADMNKDSFERNWTIPVVKSLRSKISKKDIMTQTGPALNIFFSTTTIYGNGLSVQLDRNKLPGMQLYGLSMVYDEEFTETKREVSGDELKAFYKEIDIDADFKNRLSPLFSDKKFIDSSNDEKSKIRATLIISKLPQRALDLLGLTAWMQLQSEILEQIYTVVTNRISTKSFALTEAFRKKSALSNDIED